MPGHSRSKNGVASLAYAEPPRLKRFSNSKDVDGRPAKTADVLILLTQGAKLAWLARFG
jgi:hypothetical protein